MTLSGFFKLRLAILVCVFAAAQGILLSWFYFGPLESQVRASHLKSHELFKEVITPEVLSGNHAMIYRQCRQFQEQNPNSEIRVSMENAQSICAFEASAAASGRRFGSTYEIRFGPGLEVAARLEISTVDHVLNEFVMVVLLLAVAVIALSAFAFHSGRKNLEQIIVSPISDLERQFDLLSRLDEPDLRYEAERIWEIHRLFESLKRMSVRVREFHQMSIRRETAKRLFEEAKRVAHDIRSPLGALRLIADKSLREKGQESELLRSCIQRIEAIADQFLKQSRQEWEFVENPNEILSEPVSVSKIEHEMRLLAEYKSIEIDGLTLKFRFGFVRSQYVRLVVPVFTSIISNLINNSKEAGAKVVNLDISGDGDGLQCVLADNGGGAPEGLIETLGQRGVTVGKGGKGQGLGLYLARKHIESWGGRISFENRSGGLKTSIYLPYFDFKSQ